MKFKLSSSGEWHDDLDFRCVHYRGEKHNWIERLWMGIRCDVCRRKKLTLPHVNDFRVGHMIIINGELYRFVQMGTANYADGYGVRSKEILLQSVSTQERKALGLE